MGLYKETKEYQRKDILKDLSDLKNHMRRIYRRNDLPFQPSRSFRLDEPTRSPENKIVRTLSWAEEVENTVREKEDDITARADREQWTGARRGPSNWSEELE